MTLPQLLLRTALTLALALIMPAGIRAGTCTSADFATAVDKAGASLRDYHKQARPQLKERLEKLGAQKGWSKAAAEEKGLDYLYDGRVAEFDATANEHLTKVDQLGRIQDGAAPDCANLAELERAAKDLLGVMTAKSAYLMEKIDREIAPQAKPADEQAKIASREDAQPIPRGPDKPTPPQRQSREAAVEPPVEAPPAAQFETTIIPPGALVTDEHGYTIDEIRDATRGFFGTISTELASVIEHAFSKSGRPTAYILGSEGGGALLAGLRYGKGTLYLRAGGSQPIYWHGPTIGSDIGAEGSRTLYLIYRLKDPNALYRAFAGIDGSAYFVGGVGITFLKGGDVIMAPIRSGVGLRLGANIGYLRFTSAPTWNPF